MYERAIALPESSTPAKTGKRSEADGGTGIALPGFSTKPPIPGFSLKRARKAAESHRILDSSVRDVFDYNKDCSIFLVKLFTFRVARAGVKIAIKSYEHDPTAAYPPRSASG
jgi:hypothetical protein